MSRTTEPKSRQPTYVRDQDYWIVASCHAAINQAMLGYHERNPAKYHHERPSMTECLFDPSCPFTTSATR